MKGMSIIMFRDLKELWKSVAFKVMMLVFVLLMIGASITAILSLNDAYSKISNLAPNIIREVMEQVLTSYAIPVPAYFLTMLPFIVFVWVFVYAIMGKEKASGNLDTLLATPLSPKSIAFGKSGAIFLPGIVIAVMSYLFVVLVLNTASSVLISEVMIVFPLPVLVTCLVVNPLMFLAFILLTNILALFKNPDIAIIPSFPIGFGLMLGIPIGLGLDVIDMGSWSFTFYYSLGAFAMWLVTVAMFRFLDKEKIVLSSKSG
jgi:ABC-2 type transport system permease protein